MHLHARRTARTLVGLTGAALLLGVVPGTPATAAPEAERTAPEIGLTWSELQGLAARTESAGPGGASDDSVASRQFRDVVRDPVGDVDKGPGQAQTERVGSQHADLTSLAYRTPARADGTMTVRAHWANYRNARKPGVKRQVLLTFFNGPRRGNYLMYVGNANNRLFLFDADAETMQEGRIRPEDVEIQRSFGPGGTIRVTMSTEWLAPSRLRFASIGFAGRGGIDETRPSSGLDVGPARR